MRRAILIVAALAACKGGGRKAEEGTVTMAPVAPAAAPELDGDDMELGGAGNRRAGEEGEFALKKDRAQPSFKRAPGVAKEKALDDAKNAGVLATLDEPGAPAPEAAPAASEVGPRARAWFPETFLFEPLVVTNAEGRASVEARVPDRLTSWRVLALAHARNGAQAGAVTELLGTLPAYVDPVMPPFLMVGDAVELPVQLVNTTEQPLVESLSVAVTGADVSGASGEVRLAPGASDVRYATLRAPRPGKAELRASFGKADAVVRTVEVRPSGRPVVVSASGTLAAPRSLDLTGPAGADPASDRVRLLVFPGALALLRSELGACVGRGGVAEDAYGLLLAGRGPDLLRALGDEPDEEAVRTLSILMGQRAIRHGRAAPLDAAALLAEAALSHGQSPVLVRLAERLIEQLARSQRPDGTFGGETGWSLPRLLVFTADAVRAVRASQADPAAKRRAQLVTLRAQGAFERLLPRVEDPYTAAALLASGAIDGELAEKLREKVRAALVDRKDGAKALAWKGTLERADGTRPSEVEATALAVLALEGDPTAPLADLGATLLAGYDPRVGWGDGRANLVCMQAVLRLFKDPLPGTVRITLLADGKTIAEGQLTRERVREVLALDARDVPLAGTHRYEIRAEPAVAGLGYALALQSWVPWEKAASRDSLELDVTVPAGARVGRPVDLEMKAIAPAHLPLMIVQSLPAGVQPDTASLEALVEKGTIERFETADGLLTLYVPGLDPEEVFAARIRVVPTLAGTLHGSASTIEVNHRVFAVPPVTWVVK
jgi:hypothetical protein